MTAIVAVAQRGRSYIAGDSCVSNDEGTLVSCRDPKVWRAGLWAVGAAGDLEFCQGLASIVLPDDSRAIPSTLLATLRQLYGDEAASAFDGEAILAREGDLWLLHSDGGFFRVRERYAAVGCGTHLGLGALGATPGLEPRQRLTLALELCERHCAGVRRPWSYAEA